MTKEEFFLIHNVLYKYFLLLLLLSRDRVSKKKVWCRKLQFRIYDFTNSAIYQCDIYTQGTYNIYLGVCKVSIQYVKGN